MWIRRGTAGCSWCRTRRGRSCVARRMSCCARRASGKLEVLRPDRHAAATVEAGPGGAEPVRGAACLALVGGEGAAHSALRHFPRHGAARHRRRASGECRGTRSDQGRRRIEDAAIRRSGAVDYRACWVGGRHAGVGLAGGGSERCVGRLGMSGSDPSRSLDDGAAGPDSGHPTVTATSGYAPMTTVQRGPPSRNLSCCWST